MRPAEGISVKVLRNEPHVHARVTIDSRYDETPSAGLAKEGPVSRRKAVG